MNRSWLKRKEFWLSLLIITVLVALFMFYFNKTAEAAQNVPIPSFDVKVGSSDKPEDVAVSLQILFLLTILSLAPAILIMMTSFTRVIVVLSFVRQALSTQQMPPNQVLIGLALFLTFFIMAPTWNQINDQAMKPYMNGKITQQQALDKAAQPIRKFMFKQTRDKDLALFIKLSQIKKPRSYDDIPTYVLIPAFTISELKTAFTIGFLIFIPFIVIDMIVANALMSMGMIMLPPMMISLPLKILLFIMVDGWHLIIRSLVMSFS